METVQLSKLTISWYLINLLINFTPAAASPETEENDEGNNQGGINQVLSTVNPESKQIKIVFDEAVINAFTTCHQCEQKYTKRMTAGRQKDKW